MATFKGVKISLDGGPSNLLDKAINRLDQLWNTSIKDNLSKDYNEKIDQLIPIAVFYQNEDFDKMGEFIIQFKIKNKYGRIFEPNFILKIIIG